MPSPRVGGPRQRPCGRLLGYYAETGSVQASTAISIRGAPLMAAPLGSEFASLIEHLLRLGKHQVQECVKIVLSLLRGRVPPASMYEFRRRHEIPRVGQALPVTGPRWQLWATLRGREDRRCVGCPCSDAGGVFER